MIFSEMIFLGILGTFGPLGSCPAHLSLITQLHKSELIDKTAVPNGIQVVASDTIHPQHGLGWVENSGRALDFRSALDVLRLSRLLSLVSTGDYPEFLRAAEIAGIWIRLDDQHFLLSSVSTGSNVNSLLFSWKDSRGNESFIQTPERIVRELKLHFFKSLRSIAPSAISSEAAEAIGSVYTQSEQIQMVQIELMELMNYTFDPDRGPPFWFKRSTRDPEGEMIARKFIAALRQIRSLNFYILPFGYSFGTGAKTVSPTTIEAPEEFLYLISRLDLERLTDSGTMQIYPFEQGPVGLENGRRIPWNLSIGIRWLQLNGFSYDSESQQWIRL
jgi:hypothetical protein